MKKRVTPEALADMLMKRVYVPFSAVVFSGGGRRNSVSVPV